MKRVVPKDYPPPLVLSVKDIGAAIRAARTQAGLGIRDTALTLGIAVQTLSDIERGKPGVEIGKVLHAARELGVDIFVVPRARREAARSRLGDLLSAEADPAARQT